MASAVTNLDTRRACGGSRDGRRRRAPEPVPPGADAGARRWARSGSPPRRSPTTRTSTRRRSGATCPRSASSASAASATTIDSLLGEIRKILRTQGQHNIALVGAGRLGQAIASSPIFAEHGINIAAVFDRDPADRRPPIGHVDGAALYARADDVVRDKNIIVGVLAVPAGAAQQAADDLVDSGVRIIFNYSEALLDMPPDVKVHTSNPAVELLHALYFHLDVATSALPVRILLWHGYLLEGTGSNVYTRAVAREWSARRARRHRLLPGAAAGAVRPRRREVVAAGAPDRLLPVFVLDRYEGLEARLLQDLTPERARALRRGERGGAARAPAGRPRLREPRAAGRAGGAGDGRALRGQGARLRARVLDARPAGA